MNCTLVARALYDYSPQTEEELQIHEGEILFVTNVSDPAWWSATSRDVTTGGLKNGLIPSNYVEQVSIYTSIFFSLDAPSKLFFEIFFQILL